MASIEEKGSGTLSILWMDRDIEDVLLQPFDERKDIAPHNVDENWEFLWDNLLRDTDQVCD